MEGLIENIVNDHPLKRGGLYTKKFIEKINNLKLYIPNKQFRPFLNHDLCFKSDFDKDRYLQAASEVVINTFFSKEYPSTFEYEAKNIINNKDVDCQIKTQGYTYNIEIKTPSVSEKDILKEDQLKFVLGSRIDKKQKIDIKNFIEKITPQKNN